MKQSTLNFRIEGESVIWDSGGQPSQASARERKLWAEIEQLRAALKGLHKACVHPMLYRPDSQCNAEQSRQKKRALETYSTACEATVNALRLSTPIDSGSSPACHASTSDETPASRVDVLCAGAVLSNSQTRQIRLSFETDEQFRAAELELGLALNGRGSPTA